MKVLLVIPPRSIKERWGDLLEAGALYPSMGLAYIAAVAELEGHYVRVVDAEASGLNYNDIESKIREFNPHVLGMQTFYADLVHCYKVAEIAKTINPNIKVALGGFQASRFPEEQFSNPYIDIVVRGEGEITFKDLLQTLEKGNELKMVDGITYRNSSGEIISNPARTLMVDLDELPFPALHLFPIEKYHSGANLRGNRTFQLFTSRGCIYNCSYCSVNFIFGRTVRFRSPEKIVQDIRKLIFEFGADSIQFYDDLFTINRERVFRLCEAFDRAGLNFPWSCLTRVDHVDEELLIRMRDSGCYQIFFGVETGMPRL